MSDALKESFPFTFEGQSLPLAAVDCDLEGLFTRKLQEHAADTLAAIKPMLEAKGLYQDMLREYKHDLFTDGFDWSSQQGHNARNNEWGKKTLLALMMGKCQPNVATPGLLERIVRDPDKNSELFSFPDGLYWRSIALARPTSPGKAPEEQLGNGSSKPSATPSGTATSNLHRSAT
jgi:hypothetical protein